MGKAFRGRCEGCGATLCAHHAYRYADDANGAISNSAPWLCATCYEKATGKHVKNDVEHFKDRLMAVVRKCAASGVELGRVDVLEKVIRGCK